MTLKKLSHKFPTKLIKAAEGQNSHAHRLVGEQGNDFRVPIPVGISIYTQDGVKLGITLCKLHCFGRNISNNWFQVR